MGSIPPKKFTTNVIVTCPTHSSKYWRTRRPHGHQRSLNRGRCRDIRTQSSVTLPDISGWRSGHPPRTSIFGRHHQCYPKYELETIRPLHETTGSTTQSGSLRVPGPTVGDRVSSNWFGPSRPGTFGREYGGLPSTSVDGTTPAPRPSRSPNTVLWSDS